MEDTILEDEAIIYTGLSFEHASGTGVVDTTGTTDTSSGDASSTDTGQTDSTDMTDASIQEIYDSMSDDQKKLLHFMVGEALSEAEAGNLDNAGSTDNSGAGATDTSAQHSNSSDSSEDNSTNGQEGTEMKHNVFEGSDTGSENKTPVLSHDDMKGIISSAARGGSLKDAVEEYALSHGITDVDQLFPAESLVTNPPAFLTRGVEWVSSLLGAVSKSPFSRIKTVGADLTMDEARAKGYVTGAQKAEEFFTVSKRVTTPTTIYKKQALDRDDVIDITDFDVVAWLKQEMRLMLDEELARAILLGDGRDIASPDKINEQNIRPIAKEGDIFATSVGVPPDDANAFIDMIIASRGSYKGTGMPTMFTSETVITSFLLLKDTIGRRIYATLEEVASVLRVSSIVPVEAMEPGPANPDKILAILVNPSDYIVGATAGGQVSMFDDFDIDYNKQKYLIETRVSGALTKMKSAIIIKEGIVP
jgi:hypothetical protein